MIKKSLWFVGLPVVALASNWVVDRSGDWEDSSNWQNGIIPNYGVDRAVFNTRGENPSIGAHIHNLFEIGYCYSGSGVFLIGGKIFTFKPGDAVVITSHEVHLAKGDPGGVTGDDRADFV